MNPKTETLATKFGLQLLDQSDTPGAWSVTTRPVEGEWEVRIFRAGLASCVVAWHRPGTPESREICQFAVANSLRAVLGEKEGAR